ncbi:MAG: RNA polymerase sigma factor [Polyangiales bacterium]
MALAARARRARGRHRRRRARRVPLGVPRDRPLRGRSTPKSWLFSITHNLAVDYRRRAYVRREQAESSPDAVDTGASPERGAAVAQAQVILDGILDGLPDEQRTTFLLYELGGHTGAAIAEMMEVPLQTVFSRLRAAREHVERESERLL